MFINDLKRFFKKNGSTILSVVGSIGVIGTSILSGKATYDAIKSICNKKAQKSSRKEKIKISLPFYIPTVIAGVTTICCIAGSNILNQKQQASLASACALLGESFRVYKDKVKELKGENFHNTVISNIAFEKFPEKEISENKVRFYDEFSKRYFDSTMDDVTSAIYRYNRKFQHMGCVSLNEFYELLGIAPIDCGDVFGFDAWWMGEAGLIPWIDIYTIPAQNCDGSMFYVIQFDVDPIEDYENYE